MLVLFAGLIVSILAAHSLSPVEQGYFFTFLSFAAAQTLFELGITSLILHHLSHSRAAILAATNEVERRIAIDIAKATAIYSYRYFRRASMLFFVVVGISGAVFFAVAKNRLNVNWEFPWVVMLSGAAVGLFNLTHYSHLEAFGRLNVSYRIRIRSTLLLIVVFIALTYSVGGLLPYPAALLISNGFALFPLMSQRGEVDRDHRLTTSTASIRIDLGSDQRKMAVSAVAGYVTANSLTPYAFYFFGPEIAGQVGLTMSIFAAVATVAMARVTAEAPTYGPLIANGELRTLRFRFRRTLALCSGLALALSLSIVGMREVGLTIFPEYAVRVMNGLGFVVVGLLIVANVTLSVTSTVLRAFKVELLMPPSLAAATIVLVSQLVLRLDPVYCIAMLAAFNGLLFYPYARHLLSGRIARYST